MITQRRLKAQKWARTRRAERAMILTSSPYKAELRVKKKVKEPGSATEERTVAKKRQKVASGERKGASRKRLHEPDHQSPYGATDVQQKPVADSSSDDTRCYVCRMRYAISCEEWINCNLCDRWACLPCTDADSKQISFICDMCRC